MEKQDIIVETDCQNPKNVCISIWGEKINEVQLQLGNLLKNDFDIKSREYNSKWYTDIKASKIDVLDTCTQNATYNPVDTSVLVPNSEDEVLLFKIFYCAVTPHNSILHMYRI